MKTLRLLMAFCLLLAPVVRAASESVVFDTRTGKTITEQALLDRLAVADAVFVGEQHNDALTHRLELRVLQGLRGRAGVRVTLSMEMFERDTQPTLDAYLAGTITEAAFLKASRPWSNYTTDYRPLVEYAKASHIAVVAANAPQSAVTQVGRLGLTALSGVSPEWVTVPQFTPHDDYWARFHALMAGMGSAHGGGMVMDDAAIERFYQAQCVWDTTMADSIARALEARPHALVLQVNGQFHSDYGGGIPRRLLWERPLTRVLIVSVIPVPKPPAVLSATDRPRGDYVVYVRVQ